MSYTSVKTFHDVVHDFGMDLTFCMNTYPTVALTADFGIGQIVDPATGAAATASSEQFIILLTNAKAGQEEVCGVDQHCVISEAALEAEADVIAAAKEFHIARNAGVRFK